MSSPASDVTGWGRAWWACDPMGVGRAWWACDLTGGPCVVGL